MARAVTFEICVDSVEGAVVAQEAGAGRVELCDGLVEGGTTPSAGVIRLSRRRLGIGLHVLIRPRGGDFCYSETEFGVMKADVELAKGWGADGVVFGFLRPDGTIDADRTAELLALARPMSVTFHRAFDMVRDPDEGLDTLVALGVDRILTSGGEATALEGLGRLSRLVRKAGGRIGILPGGGITEANVRKIVEQSGATEVHFSGRVAVESPMAYRNLRCRMGGEPMPSEFTRKTTSADRIRAFARALESPPLKEPLR